MTKIPVTSLRFIQRAPISAAGMKTSRHVCVHSEFPLKQREITVYDHFSPLKSVIITDAFSQRSTTATRTLTDRLLSAAAVCSLFPPSPSKPAPRLSDWKPTPQWHRERRSLAEQKRLSTFSVNNKQMVRRNVENKDDSFLRYKQNINKGFSSLGWNMTTANLRNVFFSSNWNSESTLKITLTIIRAAIGLTAIERN